MEAVLESVDFATSDGDPLYGLVEVDDPSHVEFTAEASVVRKLKDFPDVKYIFFRRFTDGRSSQPAALVIDNHDNRLTSVQLAKLHNELWLHGVAPLVYVAWPTRIDILSCIRGPDFWNGDDYQYHPAASLDLASKIDSELAKRRNFSAYRLADGTFWEDPKNRYLAEYNKAAHESLIQAIVDTDEALEGAKNPILRRLLLLFVLIKYLEDRRVFPSTQWFGRFHRGARSVFDVISSGDPRSVLKLLRTLEAHFDGDVFALPDGTTLTKSMLCQFAKLVEAKTIKQQRYLWDQFSFAHLPVEVISHLYQRFVKGRTAVYTPPFLASLLLDFAMPYHQLSGYEKVLDPSCGSGVFLVGAFRRLIEIRRAHESSPSQTAVLKQIIRDQIFGIETDPNAVALTTFSLALAVCDSLKPNVIWNELRFDRIRGYNIVESDYFETLNEIGTNQERREYDVIIGNPPFESAFSKAATRIDALRMPVRGKLPDKQIAYLFLDMGMAGLKENGTLCLIQPAGFLYNLKSHSFRSTIAKTKKLHTILDFTSIRGLFSGADPKTVAVVMRNNSRPSISHLTFRRTYNTNQQLGFELDHYDCNELFIDDLTNNPSAARANLLGGGRLRALAAKLSNAPTLRDFVASKGWRFGEGYIEGKKGEFAADYLTGKLLFTADNFSDQHYYTPGFERVTAKNFQRPRAPDLFRGPLILIGEHESIPLAFWETGPIAYTKRIVGISAPKGDEHELERVYRKLLKHRKTIQFAAALNGSQALVGKATALLKSDIESLPFPEKQHDTFTFWEEALINDTLSSFIDFVRLGQLSELFTKAADAAAMQEFSAIFCRMLKSIYSNIAPAEPIFLNGLICQPFYFGSTPLVEWLARDCEEHLRSLVFARAHEHLRTIRVVRYYHENVVFIVKPDRLRYWMKSTAIRDADDTLIDLQMQGY